MTLVNEILKASREVKNDRDVQDIFNHAVTEIGELALEIQISQGKSYKKAGPDGIIGEALDLIACTVDVIYNHYGELATEEFMISLMKPKLEKWKQKDKEIQDANVV